MPRIGQVEGLTDKPRKVTMNTTNVTRSAGISIGSGFIAGGGGTGLTASLDETVAAAAEALSARYDGAPVTIRFNSDRRSGGAWLMTNSNDSSMSGNAEIGITAGIEPDTGDVWVKSFLRPVGTVSGEDESRRAESIDAAIADIAVLALPTFDDLMGHLNTIKAEFTARCVRYVIFGMSEGLRTLQVAPHTPEGLADLERVIRSKAKANLSFSSYQRPYAASIDKGYVHVPGDGQWNSCPTSWFDATEAEAGVVYRNSELGMVEYARNGKLLPDTTN